MEGQWRSRWEEVEAAAEADRKRQHCTIQQLMETEAERVVAARAALDRYGMGVVQRGTLRFSHHPDIPDRDASLLLQALRRFRPHLLPTITALSFSWGSPPGCKNITGEALEHAACLPSLKSLDLRCCAGLTPDGLRHISKLTQLERLELCDMRGVTDAVLAHVAEMRGLRFLDVSGCVGVTDAGMLHVARMVGLRQLRMTGCPQVTSAGVSLLPGCVQVTR
ncbi:hypothetical protein CLOM_g906 [Closterium sp. NIES-68]|nr:hypothetical protein CLOM_g906 [Closterium sp. NIES-68]